MTEPNAPLVTPNDRDSTQRIEIRPGTYRNELLRRMCPTDIALLEPHLHRQFLGLRTQLETANVPIKAVYFFESGIGSVVAKLRTDVDTEVGMIGFEGMTGSALVMGDDRSAHDCYIQLDAEVFCIDVIPVRSMLSESPSLRTFLLRYAHYFHI
jgi:hypothetical protein